MSHNLNITLDQTQGGLLRTIGLIERRGFSVLSANLSPSADASQELTVRVKARNGHRSIEILARQIERLENVQNVQAHSIQGLANTASEANTRKPGKTMSFARAVASMATRRPVFEDVAT